MLPVLLLCVSFCLVSGTCPTYSCGSLPVTDCISVTSNSTNTEVEIGTCEGGYYCPPVQSGYATCQPDPEPIYYPGDFCSLDSQCSSGTCLPYGLCAGQAQGQNCSNVYDCAPGLSCDIATLTCELQGVTGAGCVQEYDCGNGLMCNLGICTPYASVQNGAATDQVMSVQTGLSLACASGYAVMAGGQWICSPPPVSATTVPMFCDPSLPNQCPDSTRKLNNPCQCGYTAQGQAYCSLFPGDPPVTQLFSLLVLLTNGNGVCNTYSRFSYNCYARTDMRGYLEQYYNFAALWDQVVLNDFPTTQNNPPCVQSVYTSDYWELVTALQDYQDSLCPRYFCSNTTVGWGTNQCILYANETFQYMTQNVMLLSECPQNSTCLPTTLLNSTCSPPNTDLGFPGDYCLANSDCSTDSCTSNICTGGIAQGQTCKNVFDCQPGLFCDFADGEPFLCQTQVALGMNCSSDFDCKNYLGCNLGQCVKYFSLPSGARTDSMLSSGLAELCASGYATVVSEEEPVWGVCGPAPVSAAVGPIECVPGTMCKSFNNVSQKPCTCGYNSAGKSYCPLFEGDQPLVLAIYNVFPT